VQEKRMDEIFKQVAEHLKDVEICKGRHVIVIASKSQVGKSTTLNALLFGKLKKRFLGCGRFEFLLPEGVKGVEIGKENSACTKLPSAHVLDDGTIVIDTRGFFDDRLNTEDEVAASIMMEYILRESESISLVYMARCRELFQHALGMNPAGEILSKIVKSENEHVLFLFNDYPAQPGEMDDMNPEERQDYVMGLVLKEAKEMVDKAIDAELKLAEKLSGNYREAGVENVDEMVNEDEDFQSITDKRRYLHVMLRALAEGEAKKGGIGYIDPTSSCSIDLLKKTLKELKPVSKDFLSFDGCNEEALNFRSYVSECKELHLSVLYGEELSQKYPVDLVTKARDEKKKECEKHERVLNELKDGNEDHVRIYENQYKFDLFEKKADDLRREQNVYESEIRKREEQIRMMEDAEPVLFWLDPWYDSGYRVDEHVVRYPFGDDIPFDSYKETLGKETKPVKIVSTSPKDFEIHYDFKPSAARIAKGVTAVAAESAGIALDVVSVGAFIPISLACNVALVSALIKENTGTVEFYVKPKLIPENAEMIKRWKNEIEEFRKKIVILDERIKQLLESSKTELSSRVQTMLVSSNRDLKKIEHFMIFENAVHQLYEKRKDDIKQFFGFVKQFYPNQDSFNEFVSLYEKVTAAEVEAETDEKQIPLSSLERPDLEKTYAECFSDLWGCQ